MIRIPCLDVTATISADMTLVKYHNREEIMKRRTFLGGTTGLTAAAAALEALLDPRPVLLDVAMSRVASHFAGPDAAAARARHR